MFYLKCLLLETKRKSLTIQWQLKSFLDQLVRSRLLELEERQPVNLVQRRLLELEERQPVNLVQRRILELEERQPVNLVQCLLVDPLSQGTSLLYLAILILDS